MKVAIVLISYNRPFFVKQALDSIKKQTILDDIHCVAVDDGSNNETVDAISAFQDDFAKFDFVQIKPEKEEDRYTTNRVAISVNAGLQRIIDTAPETQYLSYLTDDDLYEETRCEKMSKHLDENPDIFLLYHFMKLYRCDGTGKLGDLIFDLNDKWTEANKYWVSNIDNRIDHCSFMHRNLNVLWTDDNIYRRCTDYGFLLQCLKKELNFAHYPEYLATGRKIVGDSINIDNTIGERTGK